MATYTGMYQSMARISSSMSARLGEHYNAELTFQVGSGAVVVDDSGNYALETMSTTVVRAKLRQKDEPKELIEARLSSNESRTFLEGYLVSPNRLIGKFTTNVDCSITQNGTTTIGKFYFYDDVPSSLKTEYDLDLTHGQKIRGYFERYSTNI